VHEEEEEEEGEEEAAVAVAVVVVVVEAVHERVPVLDSKRNHGVSERLIIIIKTDRGLVKRPKT